MSQAPTTLQRADFSDPQLAQLVQFHTGTMESLSPREACHAFDFSSLQKPGLDLFVVYIGKDLAAMGALHKLNDQMGELKSMRTHPRFLRRGLAQMILDHLIAHARQIGLAEVALETGTGPDFEPAISLYRANGFSECTPFGDYKPHPFSQFFARPL